MLYVLYSLDRNVLLSSNVVYESCQIIYLILKHQFLKQSIDPKDAGGLKNLTVDYWVICLDDHYNY